MGAACHVAVFREDLGAGPTTFIMELIDIAGTEAFEGEADVFFDRLDGLIVAAEAPVPPAKGLLAPWLARIASAAEHSRGKADTGEEGSGAGARESSTGLVGALVLETKVDLLVGDKASAQRDVLSIDSSGAVPPHDAFDRKKLMAFVKVLLEAKERRGAV